MFSVATVLLGFLIAFVAPSTAVADDTTATPCGRPDQVPRAMSGPQPRYTRAARGRGAHVAATVAVVLDASGDVISTSIAQSSSDPELDAAATDAALATTFAPHYVDCVGVSSVYQYRADFVR